MGFGWLQLFGVRGLETGVLWLGAAIAVAVAVLVFLQRSRRGAALRIKRMLGEADALKEELRIRLSEPTALLAHGTGVAPTMGASEAFQSDIEAAARTVLQEAGWRRAKAMELLRQRVRSADDGNGKLNGSAVGYWRQLGALSLLDSAPDALTAYAKAAHLAPSDAETQMLAGVLFLRTGKLAEAEAAFRRQIELGGANGAMLARYRGQAMLGDVLALREDADAAMDAYVEAQREVRALLERDPQDPGLRRDLSVTCDRIGDMHAEAGRLDEALQSYRESLDIAEALSHRDPSNPIRQHDLSVSHDRIGEVLDRAGDPEGALASFKKGLTLAKALAAGEPDNVQRQWDLSVSHDRIGDVLLAEGRSAEALASYREGMAIAEELVRRDAAHPGWQRDLAVSYHKIGSLEALDNPAEARELLHKGRSIIARLAAIAAHQAQWRSDLAKFDDVLRTLNQ
jgi:tetratricopeptide (TPR) repeat protein